MIDDVKCPYCGEWQEIDHDGGYGYEEDVPHENECSHCEKIFVYYTNIIYTYSAGIADCLNGGEHTYKLTNTYPRCCATMRCTMCGDHRPLNDDERSKHNIGTMEE